MKAGHAVIEALRAEGIEYTFGVVGTTTNSIVTEMYGRSDIRFVDTRHEEGAAFMAYGYARASGKPTACITTSGPGTTNLITGIALAYKGRAPVLVIAGDVARDFIYRDGSQAFDLVGMFKPITKLALQVNKTERIPEMLHYAFRAALSDKCGPVFLDIPRDLLDDQTIDAEVLPPSAYRSVDARTAGDPQAIQRAVTVLAQAQRPLLLAGGGIIDAEASKEAVALAELLDMALVPSYGHTDAVPNSHHLYVGPPGGRGSGEAAEALYKADVILALGTRLNQSTTFWDHRVIHPSTRIVQVDIDAQEIGRNYPVAVGITGDARAVAEQLCRALREAYPEGRPNPAWRSEVAALAARRRARLQSELTLTGEPMMPQRVFPELRKVLPRDCMVTIDAGVAPGLAYDRLHFETAAHVLQLRGPRGPGHGARGRSRHQAREARPARREPAGGRRLPQHLPGDQHGGAPEHSAGQHRAEQQLPRRREGPAAAPLRRAVHRGRSRQPALRQAGGGVGARGVYVERPDQIADAVRDAWPRRSERDRDPGRRALPGVGPTPKQR